MSALQKAGPGSRGGHIIGTSTGGKPIYESGHARYAAMHVHESKSIAEDAKHVDGSFSHYSKADHAEAASSHFKQAYQADHGKQSPTPAGRKHMRAALAHNRLASETQKSMPQLTLAKATMGAGSRGGRVIGTTRSGKPVYASGEHTEHYHAIDHTDAAEAHNATGFLAHIHRDTATSQHHQRLASAHLATAAGPKKQAPAPRRPLHQVLSHVFAQHAYAKSLTEPDALFQQAYTSYMRKALRGEGSRGGHVIGHTPNGKPVYATDAVPRVENPEHKTMNAFEHESEGNDYADGNRPEVGQEESARMRDYHWDNAAHIKRNESLQKNGPKGAVVFYKLGAGKTLWHNQPAKGEHYAHFTAEDHHQAAQQYALKGNEPAAQDHAAERDRILNKRGDTELQAAPAAAVRDGSQKAVLGKTSTGKLVYQAKHISDAHYKAFTPAEHLEAAKLHNAKSHKSHNQQRPMSAAIHATRAKDHTDAAAAKGGGAAHAEQATAVAHVVQASHAAQTVLPPMPAAQKPLAPPLRESVAPKLQSLGDAPLAYAPTIGTTSSGKPIYQKVSDSLSAGAHYNAQDHQEASAQHHALATVTGRDLLENTPRARMSKQHYAAYQHHLDEHLYATTNAMNRTDSGKTVYRDKEPNNRVYKNFTAKDHERAGNGHDAEATKHPEGSAAREHHHAMASAHWDKAEEFKAKARAPKGPKRPTAVYTPDPQYGKVIGKTSSGKIVYDKESGHSAAYAHFGERDHRQAMKLHGEQPDYEHPTERYGHTPRRSLQETHEGAIDGIRHKKYNLRPPPKEVTRTGETVAAIGRTRSGKSVLLAHDASSPHYAGFNAEDHADAMQGHWSAAREAKDAGRGQAEALHYKRAQSHLNIISKLAPRGKITKTRHEGRFTPAQHTVAALPETKKSFYVISAGAPALAATKLHKSLTTEHAMNSTDIFEEYLAKGQFKSGNIENAETVDGIDADMTGASSKGKSTSGPGGFDDQEDEDKKTKKKVTKNEKNGDKAVSVATTVGYQDNMAGTQTQLNNVGPYGFGGDVTGNIGEAPPTRTVDSNILRSEEVGDLLKAGAGSRGGKVIGHTKSGKAVYAGNTAQHHANFTHEDHADAMHLHDEAGNKAKRGAVGFAAHNKNTSANDHRMASASHEKAMQQTAKSFEAANYYQAPDAKTYEAKTEQRGFVTHTTGGMDQYLASLVKGGHFYANGADSHTPNDTHTVGQMLCKSCNGQHSALYTVCPNCAGDAGGLAKSYRNSQANHGVFGMPGQEQGSTLVDMSRFSLED